MSTWIVFYFSVLFLKISLYSSYKEYMLISLILCISMVCYAAVSTSIMKNILNKAVKQYSERVKSVIPLKGIYFIFIAAIVTPFVTFKMTGNLFSDITNYMMGVLISVFILKVTRAHGYRLCYLLNGYDLCIIQTEDGALKVCMMDKNIQINHVCDFFYFDGILVARRVDNV